MIHRLRSVNHDAIVFTAFTALWLYRTVRTVLDLYFSLKGLYHCDAPLRFTHSSSCAVHGVCHLTIHTRLTQGHSMP